MNFRTRTLFACLTTLALACDAEPSDPEPTGQTGGGKADAAGDKGPPGEACADGFAAIDGEGDCIADADCYALPGGQWCTGECPEGLEIDDSDNPQCFEPAGDCAQGYEAIADTSACIADADCYELPNGVWCTGECPAGLEIDDSESPQCFEPPAGTCAEGYEEIADPSECWADAGCYELPGGSWCTGLCPVGEQLDDAWPPQCEVASCLPGFDFAETQAGCLADATCYETDEGWCTGECPEGEAYAVGVFGPICEPA